MRLHRIALAAADNTLVRVAMAGVVGGVKLGLQEGAVSLVALAEGGAFLILVWPNSTKPS